MAARFRTIILAGFVIGGVGGVVLPDVKFEDAAPIQDQGIQALTVNAEPLSALDPMATAEPGPANADTWQARTEGWAESKARETNAANPSQTRTPESLPMQLAALTPPD